MTQDLRAVYLHSSGSWAATLADPKAIPACPPASLMLIADPGVTWEQITSSVVSLKTALLADAVELNAVEGSAE